MQISSRPSRFRTFLAGSLSAHPGLLLAGSVLAVGCTVATTTAEPKDPNGGNLPEPTAVPEASFKPLTHDSGSASDWNKPNANGKANGEACSKPDDCKSGVCEGEGCETGPKCVDPNRACTRDLVAYCGCNGKGFATSGSCAGRPFKKRGACD